MSWGKYPSIEERDLVHGTPIKVYKNGDPWFPGKRVVVNQRQHPTFESFLNYLTSTLKEERAVRRLYTPNHGTRITDYDQIKPENVYVTSHALGSNEHLKRIRWDVHTFFSISLTHFISLSSSVSGGKSRCLCCLHRHFKRIKLEFELKIHAVSWCQSYAFEDTALFFYFSGVLGGILIEY